MGAFGFYSTKEVRFHHLTLIDNVEGFGASLGSGGTEGALIMLSDNKIYGDTPEVTDCPSDGSYCYNHGKSGFLISGIADGGKGLMITSGSKLPVSKIKGDATWGGIQKFYRNEFINYESTTAQGAG